MVQRVWRTHMLAPHRVRTFKLSRDKRFIEKRVNVVGLYLRPPENALVLSVDERRARFRPWIAPSLDCRSRRVAVER